MQLFSYYSETFAEHKKRPITTKYKPIKTCDRFMGRTFSLRGTVIETRITVTLFRVQSWCNCHLCPLFL